MIDMAPETDLGRRYRLPKERRSQMHGHTFGGWHTPTYAAWNAVLYGGAPVCDRWSDFRHFLSDMGEKPEGTTLGRIHLDRHFGPDNCAWLPAAFRARKPGAQGVRAPDLAGEPVGRLVVLRYVRFDPAAGRIWLCRCSCGNEFERSAASLQKRRPNASCDACRPSYGPHATTPHAMTRTPTWNAWRNMWTVCRVETHPSFPRYGGRGVDVCERWADFRNFFADMGTKPSGKMLWLLGGADSFAPGNCAWVSRNRFDRADDLKELRARGLSRWPGAPTTGENPE